MAVEELGGLDVVAVFGGLQDAVVAGVVVEGLHHAFAAAHAGEAELGGVGGAVCAAVDRFDGLFGGAGGKEEGGCEGGAEVFHGGFLRVSDGLLVCVSAVCKGLFVWRCCAGKGFQTACLVFLAV